MRTPPLVSTITGLMVFAALCAALPGAAVAQAGAPEPLVRGFIAASVGGKSETAGATLPAETIYLPNVRVVLRNLTTQSDSEPATTDLSGRFTARLDGPGKFRVCWQLKGFKSGCTDQEFSASRRFENIGTVRIPLPQAPRTSAVYGRVTLADGSSPRRIEPLANINSFATIALLDVNGTRIYETPVNNDDRYLFPVVPIGQMFRVHIRQEGYDNTHAFRLSAVSGPMRRVDFVILNNPPEIEPLVLLDNNNVRVSAARVGATFKLNVRASDRDKDNLKFLW